FLNLLATFYFSKSQTFRIRTVYPIDPGHIDPHLAFTKTGNQDSTLHRKMITCLTSLFHYASQSYYDELVILSKVFCWNKVCQVGPRLFSNGHTQLVGIHTRHTEHQGRRLCTAIIITLLT